MVKGKWYSAWCPYFVSLFEERRLKPSQFADLVDETRNNISQYQHGLIKPPLEKLNFWADRLKLTEEERSKFFRLAHLAHTPDDVSEEMEKLRVTQLEMAQEVKAMRQRTEKLVQQLEDRDAEILRLKSALQKHGINRP